MPSTVIQLLKAARAVIESPEHWAQGALHYDEQGELCNMEYAHSFCAMGAVHKAVYDKDNPFSLVENTAIDAITLTVKGVPLGTSKHPIAAYNDNFNRTHAEVLALFDETITRLESLHHA